jgi:hypothetical protein
VPDPTVRFAAGSPERPHSAVWRLWVHGADAYVGARTILGLLKLSMHRSGDWISAFTSQSDAVIEETGSRRTHTWQRPAEFTPGWTQGPAVMVPWVSWRDELRSLEEMPADTEWVPGPKRNKKLIFNVLLSAAGVERDASSVSRPSDRVLDRSLPMSNGEAVWLQVRQAEMSPDENKGIASAEREFRGFRVTGSLDSVGAWGLWITTSNEGVPILVQIPLGRRHFIVDERAKGAEEPQS